MKPFEERFTAWVDGKLTGSELAEFEAELAEVKDSAEDKAAAHEIGNLLRQHYQPAELTNIDFFNHQLMQSIQPNLPESPPSRTHSRSAPSFSWMAWSGSVSLILAFMLFQLVIPEAPQRNPSPAEYVTQVINAHTTDPAIFATALPSKEGDPTVLWLDGLDYLPENYALK